MTETHKYYMELVSLPFDECQKTLWMIDYDQYQLFRLYYGIIDRIDVINYNRL